MKPKKVRKKSPKKTAKRRAKPSKTPRSRAARPAPKRAAPKPAAPRKRRPLLVLLIEDDPEQVRLVRRLSEGCSTATEIVVAITGVTAQVHFRGDLAGPTAERRPDLILLDLSLPGVDGRTLLPQLRADPSLASVPVVIVTSSSDPQDVLLGQQLHVQGYLRKPVTQADLEAIYRQAALGPRGWSTAGPAPPPLPAAAEGPPPEG